VLSRGSTTRIRMSRPSSSQSRTPIESRLRARRGELEQAVLARVRAIANPDAAPDPAYLAGLRDALAAALEYGLAAVSSPKREPGPVPVALLSQARLAARNGVGLEAVLRRYSAGHTLLADALLEEAAAGITAAEVKASLRSLAAHYDRIVAAVSEEYGREAEVSAHDPEHRRAELLRRLLAGQLLDTSDLDYDLNAHHLAITASGPELAESLSTLAERLDRRLLFVHAEEDVAWAWVGGRRRIRAEEIDLLASFDWPDTTSLACGEAAEGLAGWRLSHRQATAAHPVARRLPQPFVRYPDVALVASVLQDDLLAASLRRRYLAPLESERDRGVAARDTLRAYFAAAGNVSSAAAALGVNRRTVSARIAAIEDRLEHSLDGIRTELDLALRLDEIEGSD
jgi:DNA-binding PucR family transcriptional regulator